MNIETVEDNKQLSFFETLTWLWRFWGNLRPLMFLLLILTPIGMWFKSCSPLFIANIFNELQTGNPDISFIKDQAMIYLIFGVIHVVMYSFIQSLRGITNFKLESDFRLSLFEYIIKLGQSFFQKFNTGDLITRLIDDVSEKKLAWFACSGIFRFYEAVIRIVQAVYYMFYLSVILTWVTIIPLVLLVVIYIWFSNKTTNYSKNSQKAISELNSFLTNTFDGIRIIKSYNQEEKQENFFDKVVENQRQKELELVKASSVIELGYSRLSEIVVIVIFAVGGYLVINNSIPLGTLIAFNTFVFMLIWPMVDIGQFFIKGRMAGVSVQRIKELENFKPDIINPISPKPFPKEKHLFEFKNIDYVFPNGNKVLNDVSFSVKQGEVIAIVGSVGSGKSTFLNFIPRITDPSKGKVLLNGEDLKCYDLFDLRNKIGFISQSPSLFSDSVKENIIFGRENISEDDLEKAIKVSQLDKEIEIFPKKLDTIIGQRGITLSGGQKQRVSIARAIVSKPEILILDDCTSALDVETESKLWDALYQFIPGITVFLVTHRISTLEKVNKIIVLESGKVVDIGSHQELIERSDYYKRIYFSEESK